MTNKVNVISFLFFLVSILSFGQHAAIFNQSYQKLMQDSVTFEIPEVNELFHVIAAITPFGKSNTDIIDKTTDYYQEVLVQFESFESHPIVRKIQKELKRNRYNRLKMDACGFYFNNAGNLIKDETYPTLSFETKNWLQPYIAGLQEFSKATGFRKFYNSHKAYYAQLIELQKEQLAVKEHWQWLENKFDIKYNSYRITFSPLVYGSHSANHFKDGNFQQSVMFIGPPYITQKYSKTLLEGLAGRMVFTEIDHNYINPLSEIYSRNIEALFKDLDHWNDMTLSDYQTALSTFNEYVTYSFYSLFVMDYYAENDAEIIIQRCVELMEKRGFINYARFNNIMMSYYMTHQNSSAEEIYLHLFNSDAFQ